MANLSRPEDRLLAGIPFLLFAEFNRVSRWPALAADGVSLVGDIALFEGTTWTYLQARPYTSGLDAEAEVSAAGVAYPIDLAGFYDGEGPEVASQILKMQGRRFVVMLRDVDGSVRLAGDPRAGLRFTAKYQTGTTPGQQRGWAWAFKGKLPAPLRYYAGAFDITDGVVPPPITVVIGGGDTDVVDILGNVLFTIPAGKRLQLNTAFSFTHTIVD